MWHSKMIFEKSSIKIPHFFDGSSAVINWEFEKFESMNGFTIIKCHMKSENSQTEGYGTGFSTKNAYIRSFGEAWERLALTTLNKPKIKFSSSNGFAAGQTLESAKEAAIAELIERETVQLSWSCLLYTSDAADE